MVAFAPREDYDRDARYRCIFSSSARKFYHHSFVKREDKAIFRGTKINHQAPTVSHSMFADDLMILGKASAPNLEMEKQILDIYSSRSGQVINYSKYSFFFTNNLSNSVNDELANIFGVQYMKQDERYFRAPLFATRRLVSCHKYLIKKMHEKLKG